MFNHRDRICLERPVHNSGAMSPTTTQQCCPGRHQPKYKSDRKSNRNIEPKGEMDWCRVWIGIFAAAWNSSSIPKHPPPHPLDALVSFLCYCFCSGVCVTPPPCLCDTTYEQAVSVQVSQEEILAFFVSLSGMLYYKFALWKTKRPPQKKNCKNFSLSI